MNNTKLYAKLKDEIQNKLSHTRVLFYLVIKKSVKSFVIHLVNMEFFRSGFTLYSLK